MLDLRKALELIKGRDFFLHPKEEGRGSFGLANSWLWPHSGEKRRGSDRTVSSQQRPERTELSEALSHFDWNSDDQSIKKHEHFMCSCIFLVYFPIASHIFSDALCGNVSLSQLCSREQETVVPDLGQVLKGGSSSP